MRVLVVEDDVHISDFLKSHLPKQGFAVSVARDGAEGLRLFEQRQYDLVILDLNLPDMTGEQVVEKIHENEHVPPILMLTVVPDTKAKVRLLNAGADDYILKPFSLDELVARMRALLRRSSDVTPSVLTVGDVALDAEQHTVHRSDTEIALTQKEFMLLEFLMRNYGVAVKKSTLIEHVWDAVDAPTSNAVDTHVANIRKKLGQPNIIHTVHGRGYKVE